MLIFISNSHFKAKLNLMNVCLDNRDQLGEWVKW